MTIWPEPGGFGRKRSTRKRFRLRAHLADDAAGGRAVIGRDVVRVPVAGASRDVDDADAIEVPAVQEIDELSPAVDGRNENVDLLLLESHLVQFEIHFQRDSLGCEKFREVRGNVVELQI